MRDAVNVKGTEREGGRERDRERETWGEPRGMMDCAI